MSLIVSDTLSYPLGDKLCCPQCTDYSAEDDLITDILRVKIVHLVDRSELFKLVVWFMMEEKLQRVSIAAYRDREFYGELTISMFVSVKIDGLGKVWKN